MIIHDVEQDTQEWWDLRLGKLTVSKLSRIITPSRLEYSKGARALIAELMVERRTQRITDWGSTEYSDRGKEMEAEAVRWYQFERDVDVERVGFISTDDGEEGGSPDGLVGDDGGLEVKCYGAKHHMELLLGHGGDIAPMSQVQGYLRLTGRKWWDVLAYNPDFPPVLNRVYRNEAFIKALDECVEKFHAEMKQAEEGLAAIGERGRIDGTDLLAQLAASIREGATDIDMEEVRADLDRAKVAGILDEPDIAQILEDARAGRWDEVQRMHDHALRALAHDAEQAMEAEGEA